MAMTKAYPDPHGPKQKNHISISLMATSTNIDNDKGCKGSSPRLRCTTNTLLDPVATTRWTNNTSSGVSSNGTHRKRRAKIPDVDLFSR